MAITGTAFVPGTAGAEWISEVWAKNIDRAAYHKAKLWPIIEPDEPLMGHLHIPKYDELTAATIATTVDTSGHGLTFTAAVQTEIDVTPTDLQLNVSMNDNMIFRMMANPMDPIKTSIEMALGFKVDQDLFALIGSLTTNVEGDYATNTDKSGWLSLQAQVENGAREYAEDGLFAFFAPLQGDHVRSVSEFMGADFRGDGENPAVTGLPRTAYGMKWASAGAVADTNGGYDNAIVVKRGLALSWNQRVNIESQRFGRAQWLLGYASYGVATKRDAYLGLYKSLNT